MRKRPALAFAGLMTLAACFVACGAQAASLRVSYYLGFPLEGGMPFAGTTLSLSSTPTPGGSQPTVPLGSGPSVLARFQSDAVAYVDLGTSPDPVASVHRILVTPSQPVIAQVTYGQFIAAVLSSDITGGSGQTVAATQSGAWTFGLTGPIPAGSNAIGTVSVTSLPLPTGAALETGNLATIAGAVSSGALKVAPQSNAPRASATGNLAASGDNVVVAVDGMSAIGIQVSSGWTGGPIVLEASQDGGTTYPIAFSAVPYTGGPGVSSITAGGNWEAAVGALTNVRVRATATIAGGPAVVNLIATNGIKSLRVGAPSSNPIPTAIAIGTPVEGSSVPGALTGLNLLSTVAPSTRLGWWFVQNQSAVTLTVALDDGAGNALSTFDLAPGSGAGAQGGSMGSADTGSHTGRIRVYGAAGSQHALRVQ